MPDAANAKSTAPTVGRAAPERHRFQQRNSETPSGDFGLLHQQAAHLDVPWLAAMPHPAPGEARPLDPSVRSIMESRFHTDLGMVRVHSGERSAALARSRHAAAFTQGSNIVFGAGRFAPHDPHGR